MDHQDGLIARILALELPSVQTEYRDSVQYDAVKQMSCCKKLHRLENKNEAYGKPVLVLTTSGFYDLALQSNVYALGCAGHIFGPRNFI